MNRESKSGLNREILRKVAEADFSIWGYCHFIGSGSVEEIKAGH
jgi:hypothetical protein